MSELVHPVPIRALDADGNPVAAAEAYFFREGTTTPLVVYADSAGSTSHPVPLAASADGTFAKIYNTSSFGVKVDVRDPVTDVSLPGYPLDPAIVSDTGAIAAADVTFTATSDIAQTDVQAAIEQVQENWLAAKTGVDADIVSGTAGTAGNLAEWNADGDLVNGPDVLDEDDMASDSATAVATQQSIKAYVDAATGGAASASWTLLGTIDTATGTPSSVTLTGLTLTDRKWMRCVFDAVSGTTTGNILCAGEPIIVATSLNTDINGWVDIDLTSGVAIPLLGVGAGAIGAGSRAATTTLTSASTSITFSVSAGTFDAGEIKIYGAA